MKTADLEFLLEGSQYRAVFVRGATDRLLEVKVYKTDEPALGPVAWTKTCRSAFDTLVRKIRAGVLPPAPSPEGGN